MALSFNGIPWANLRGYCYTSWQADIRGAAGTPGGSVTPLPSQVFPGWWKNTHAPTFPIQVNFGRIDGIGWLGFYNGGQGFNPAQTFPNPTAVQQYMAAVDDIFTQADAAGISLVINQSCNPVTAGIRLPSLTGLTADAFFQLWYQNSPYPGTEPPYQGMSFWDACWNGFTKPLLQLVDHHPSVIGYKIANEPGHINFVTGTQNQILKTVGNFFGQKLRTISTKPLIFQTYEESTSPNGLALKGSDITTAAPDVAFAPFLYSIHYPDPNATSVANLTNMNLIQNAIAGGQVPGCQSWYTDEAGTGGNGFSLVHLQGCKAFGIPAPMVFTYRVNSLLDASGNPTANCLSVSSMDAQVLGPALYFGGPPPPPQPTKLALSAAVV